MLSSVVQFLVSSGSYSKANTVSSVTKHCNIIYQGAGTESFIDVTEVQKCKVDKFA